MAEVDEQPTSKSFRRKDLQQLLAHAVHTEAARAKAALPTLSTRIDRARDLVLGGLVQRLPDGSFQVASGTAKGKYYTVDRDGHCDCPDAVKVGGGRCKHLLATWIWRRARAAVETPGTNGTVPAPDRSTAPAERPAPAAPPLHAAAPRGRGIGDGLRARQLPAAAIVRAIWAASSVSSGWPQIDSTES